MGWLLSTRPNPWVGLDKSIFYRFFKQYLSALCSVSYLFWACIIIANYWKSTKFFVFIMSESVKFPYNFDSFLLLSFSRNVPILSVKSCSTQLNLFQSCTQIVWILRWRRMTTINQKTVAYYSFHRWIVISQSLLFDKLLASLVFKWNNQNRISHCDGLHYNTTIGFIMVDMNVAACVDLDYPIVKRSNSTSCW